MDRVVFIGNCQAEALCVAYRRTLPHPRRGAAQYIRSYTDLTVGELAELAAADTVVLQQMEWDQHIEGIREDARVLKFPLVTSQFIWPNAGEPHPNNPRPDHFPDGPYPAEIGDRFLNDLVRAGASPSEGEQRWMETDFAAKQNVARVFEIAMEQQRKRDRACGPYRVAEMVERLLPVEPLFRTRGHPEPILLRYLMETLGRQMGLDDAAMDIVLNTDYGNTMPRQTAPIHASIATALDLYFITPQTLYQFHNEGGFNASDYVRRYMACEWDANLEEGLFLFHHKRDPIAALPLLEAARVTSPRSSLGANTLMHARAAYDRAQRAA